MEIAVKQRGQLLRRNALAGVCDREKQPLALRPQLHSDGAAGGSELKGVGEKVEQKLLQQLGLHRADTAGKGAGEPQFQIQGLGQAAGPAADVLHELHKVPVLEGERGVLRESRGG